MSRNLEAYWNEIYESTEVENLGWYEEVCTPSIELFQKTSIKKDDRVLVAGAGMSNLLNWLLDKNFQIIANDISEKALIKAQKRLGSRGSKIQWIQDDLANSTDLREIPEIKLWYDRAVLHFLTRDIDRVHYFDLIRKLVAPGGFVIIAVFSKEGSTFCSGLPVINYDTEMISYGLGNDFYLIDSFHYVHGTPSGDRRPYIYTLLKREGILSN